MPNKDQYRQLIAQQLSQLDTAIKTVIQGKEREALHDFRVALRSLRALLPVVLQPRKKLDCAIFQAWKALAKLSNASRDAEVMIELLGQDISAAQMQTLKQAYDSGMTQLKKILISSKLASLSAITLQQCERRIGKITSQRLGNTIRKQQQIHIKALFNTPPLSDTSMLQWHERRIAIKHLRYLSELARAWSSAPIIALLPRLKSAQTAIGDLHDDFVLAQWLGHAAKISRLPAAKYKWRQLIKKINSIAS